MPHTFVVGTVTDAARVAIERDGGNVGPARIQPNIPASLITLPEAHAGDNNWQDPMDAINTRWSRIHLPNAILRFTTSWHDPEGTLDITKEQHA